jgi:superfamily II DNA/RNA helicase
LGFLLPAFDSILSHRSKVVEERTAATLDRRSRASAFSFHKSPQLLVLAPTRELCMQIASEAEKYTAAGICTVPIYGGASKNVQISRLRKGVDCVVATPGRCNDLIDMGVLDVRQIKYLVLDEADRM